MLKMNGVKRIINITMVFLMLSGLIAIPGCGPKSFTASNLSIKPAEAYPGEVVTITVDITNPGSANSEEVVLNVDGVEEETVNVDSLASKYTIPVDFRVTREEVGEYNINIKGLSGSFTVKPQKATIKVEIIASTWRDGEPYDIQSAIKEKLPHAGCKILSRGSEVYNATLHMEYEETKGGVYSGSTTGSVYGTTIHCDVELRDNTGKLLYETVIYAKSPPKVYKTNSASASNLTSTLYDGALRNFKSTYDFYFLGEMLAMKTIGVGDEVTMLISVLEDIDPNRVERAATYLGEIGDDRAVEYLVKLLDSEYSYVRSAATKALDKIGIKEQ